MEGGSGDAVEGWGLGWRGVAGVMRPFQDRQKKNRFGLFFKKKKKLEKTDVSDTRAALNRRRLRRSEVRIPNDSISSLQTSSSRRRTSPPRLRRPLLAFSPALLVAVFLLRRDSGSRSASRGESALTGSVPRPLFNPQAACPVNSVLFGTSPLFA